MSPFAWLLLIFLAFIGLALAALVVSGALTV
jgi:hypothetical protein